jgi:hypothetical protein
LRWPPNRSRKQPGRRSAAARRAKSASTTSSRSKTGTWGYSFSLNTQRQPVDPYNEYRHLQITGKLLQPSGMKSDKVEMSLLPSFDMGVKQRKDFKPIALGSLDAYPDRIDGHVGIPQDALPPILQMLIAGQFRFMLLRGSKFRYRSARLHSLRLEMKLSEDDMPTAD